MSKKSLSLVIVQILSILYLIYSIRLAGLTLFPIFLISLGISIGIIAVFYMRKSRLSVFPEVTKDTKLVTDGIYKLIRHPIYTSVLISSLGFLLTNLEALRIVFFIFLMIDLLIKIKKEEAFLKEKFPVKYNEYLKKSYKLIPYIY